MIVGRESLTNAQQQLNQRVEKGAQKTASDAKKHKNGVKSKGVLLFVIKMGAEELVLFSELSVLWV